MKKIMFNDKYGLTQAVLEGKKTQTRRVINDLDKVLFYDFGIDDNGKQYASFSYIEVNITLDIYFPYQVGEVVAIAQKYSDIENMPFDREFEIERGGKPSAGWDNKMFVEAMYMQHHIRLTNVRVERLQAISDEDCIAEGIRNECGVFKYTVDNALTKTFMTAKDAYASLIDKVGKKGTWESNPWVFVYEFQLVD